MLWFRICNANAFFSIFTGKKILMSGDRYLIADPNAPYFVTFTVVDWVDVFTRIVYKQLIVDNLNYCIANKGLKVWAWCLMSNHLHAVLQANEDYGLSAIIRDYKKFTSKAIVSAINTTPESRKEWMLHRFAVAGKYDSRIMHNKFWQESNHAIFFDPLQPQLAKQKINYIHHNPVRAGIVEKPEEYLYSSARDYCGKEGLVKTQLWI
jgi:REP element-mobilizing transposase RayT